MFTAKVLQVAKANGRIILTIEYTNGAERFTEDFSIGSTNYTLDVLKGYLKERCDAFNSVYSFADTIPVDEVIDTTPKPPSQDVLDRQAFFVDYQALQTMQRLIDAGVKKDSDQDFLDLTTRVKQEYKAEYF